MLIIWVFLDNLFWDPFPALDVAEIYGRCWWTGMERRAWMMILNRK